MPEESAGPRRTGAGKEREHGSLKLPRVRSGCLTVAVRFSGEDGSSGAVLQVGRAVFFSLEAESEYPA